MRLSHAFDRLQDENQFLKILLITSSIAMVMVVIFAFVSSEREPLVVERACESSALPIGASAPSEHEQRVFLKTAILQRFNSDEVETSLLSPKQLQFRDKEQNDLSKNKMTQVVFVRDLKFQEKEILVDLDRLISVGEIRSAFKFPVKVQIAQVLRTKANPYGLVLTEMNPLTEGQK